MVYIFNIKSLPLHSGERVPFRLVTLISFLNLGLAGFVLAAVAARFIFPGISLEGRQMWLLRSSPLDPSAMLWSKYWIGTVPLLVLALIITVFTNWLLHASTFMMAVAVGTIVLYTLAASALALSFGALYPQFGTENAAQIPTSFGGLVYMMSSLSLLAVIIMIEASPVTAYLRMDRYGGQLQAILPELVASALLIVGVCRHGYLRPAADGPAAHRDDGVVRVDLFSDTVTRPTPAMRRVMCGGRSRRRAAAGRSHRQSPPGHGRGAAG